MIFFRGILRITKLEIIIVRKFRYFPKRHGCSKEEKLNDFPNISEIIGDENRKECIRKIKSMKLSHNELTKENKKRAAVLIPLCVMDNELGLLYTLRRPHLKRHRGQVSFPGGVEDVTDSSLEETALRETEEELGINRSNITVWGSGSIVVGNEFSVLPVLGFVGELNLIDLKPNPAEVELPFVIPLRHFCSLENCRFTQFRVGKSKGYILPVYINTRFRIWGITALITHVVLCSLLPKHYKHKLEYIRPVISERSL